MLEMWQARSFSLEPPPVSDRRLPSRMLQVNNSTLVVDGVVEGWPTKMLIDSGSAVTILREDVWKAASTKLFSLDTPGPPVVVANGEALDLFGRRTVSLKITGVKVNHPCLVTSELTQECIIGVNFLLENKCIIDLCNQVLLAGGLHNS